MSETLRLYHFMRTEHALQAVERRRLKFSDLDKVNDPYDALPIKFDDPDEEGKFLKTYKGLTEITNVISLSKTCLNPALWGHYADRCEGICLGFDVQRDDGPTNKAAKRVQYVKSRLDISDVGMRFADDKVVPRDDVAALDWSREVSPRYS